MDTLPLIVGDRFRPWDNIFNTRKVPPVIMAIIPYAKPYFGLTHFVRFTADTPKGYVEQSIDLKFEQEQLWWWHHQAHKE